MSSSGLFVAGVLGGKVGPFTSIQTVLNYVQPLRYSGFKHATISLSHIWGIPSRRDPLWVCRPFFFEILQNHTYGHASGRGKKWFG